MPGAWLRRSHTFVVRGDHRLPRVPSITSGSVICSDIKKEEPRFPVLRAFPSQTMTGTLRWTLLIHDSNSLFYRATVRSRDNMVETHKLFHMENSEWHFPHILHTSRALVRSSNFEELSSRPLGRGVVKQNTRQRSRRTPAADSSKTSTSNISSCRTGRHARPQAHRRTQTHALTQTQDYTRRHAHEEMHAQTYAATVPFTHGCFCDCDRDELTRTR